MKSRVFSLNTLGILMVSLAAAGCAQDNAPELPPPLPDGGLHRDMEPPEADTGTTPPDAEAPSPDAGSAEPDGSLEPDAETPLPDAEPPTPDGALDPDASPPEPDAFVEPPPPPDEVRLAIEVNNDVPESIYIQLADETGQPDWVRLSHGGQRYFLFERCDYPSCDGPPAPVVTAPGGLDSPEGVCGAALPLVRDITGGDYTGSFELLWDGMVSRIDEAGDCEIREAAPPGDWTATFCWSLSADLFQDGGNPSEQAAGHVVNPTCVDVPFTLPDVSEVVYHISGG